MGRNRISSEAFVSFISRILFFDVTEFLSQFFYCKIVNEMKRDSEMKLEKRKTALDKTKNVVFFQTKLVSFFDAYQDEIPFLSIRKTNLKKKIEIITKP